MGFRQDQADLDPVVFDTNWGGVLAPPVRTSGAQTALTITPAANTNQTASTEISDFVVSAYTKTWSAGALTTQRFTRFMAPTLAFSSASTVTTAATVAISGAPIAGANANLTNSFALWIQAGEARFDGKISTVANNVTTGSTVAITADNTTAATSGVTQQFSPLLEQTGTQWDGTALVSTPVAFASQVQGKFAGGSVFSYWTLLGSVNSSPYTPTAPQFQVRSDGFVFLFNSIIPYTSGGASVGTVANPFAAINFNSPIATVTTAFQLSSGLADTGASAFIFNAANAQTNTAARPYLFRNGGVDIAYLDKDGNVFLKKETNHTIAPVQSATTTTVGADVTLRGATGASGTGGAAAGAGGAGILLGGNAGGIGGAGGANGGNARVDAGVGTGAGVSGDINIGNTNAVNLNLGRSAGNIGFFGVTAVAKQTSGANLTNNVTSGGTNDTIADFTDLSVYANDAATIRNDIYQLSRKLKQVNDALRLYGLLT